MYYFGSLHKTKKKKKVDQTETGEAKVDETAVDEPGPHHGKQINVPIFAPKLALFTQLRLL